MSEEQKQAVLDRDFNQLIELGGNIYFLVKLSNTDGWSTQQRGRIDDRHDAR